MKTPDFNAGSVTLAFDKYRDLSVKAREHQRTGTLATQSIQTHQITENRNMPTFRQFLMVPMNKSALVAFVSEYILANDREIIPGGKNDCDCRWTDECGRSCGYLK